jgi:CDP-glucose 4,6-dehydratase
LWGRSDGLAGEAFNFGPDAHVSETVAELLGAMATHWTDVQWLVSESREPGAREARLLKLSCDKALFHLKWRAVLQFPETVAFTIDWYRTWHEGGHDLHGYTVGQIEQYCRLAQARNMTWVRS